ncbi:unnamed protein product [Diamesa serratosioi]
MFFICSLIALAAAVPPKRFNSQRIFKSQRQVAAEEESQGYNYDAPQGERLRLPTREFARQEEGEQQEQSGGYHYPRPTDSYGPPAEEPSTEYGPPATEETDNGESTTDSSEETTNDSPTEEPEFENLRSLQSQQYRRRNSKIIDMKAQKIQLQQVPLQQPRVFIQYPTEQFVQQPQYYYIL